MFKKPANLRNIYYYTSIFQGISLGFKQFVGAVYKDWPDKYNTFKNEFLHLGRFSFQLFAR